MHRHPLQIGATVPYNYPDMSTLLNVPPMYYMCNIHVIYVWYF